MSDLQIPAFYTPVSDIDIVREDFPIENRLRDTDGATLPFTQLSGIQFEILAYHLLSDAPQHLNSKVILVKSSGDQGRDVLVYVGGSLHTVVQCKNLAAAVTKPQLLRELVKLVSHDLLTPFLPSTGVNYELWAPGGLSEPAELLLAEWPNKLSEADVKAAFLTVTSEYQRLDSLRWDESGERLLGNLRNQIPDHSRFRISLLRRLRWVPLFSIKSDQTVSLGGSSLKIPMTRCRSSMKSLGQIQE